MQFILDTEKLPKDLRDEIIRRQASRKPVETKIVTDITVVARPIIRPLETTCKSCYVRARFGKSLLCPTCIADQQQAVAGIAAANSADMSPAGKYLFVCAAVAFLIGIGFFGFPPKKQSNFQRTQSTSSNLQKVQTNK